MDSAMMGVDITILVFYNKFSFGVELLCLDSRRYYKFSAGINKLGVKAFLNVLLL
jgi:hypothetical protein